MQSTTLKQRISLLAAGSILLLAMFAQMLNHANAAALSNAFVRFDRMKVSQATTGTVCARPTTVASTEASVNVTFPTGYTTSTTVGNWTVNTTNIAWPTAVSPITAVVAWPGIGTATAAVGASGGTITFPSGDLTSATTLYCFNWANTAAVSVAAGASPSIGGGSISTRDSVPTVIDTASFSTAAITDDQIVVTASVPQTFSFAISNNADGLGALTTGAVASSPTPRTATVNTNAKNGWYVWAKDSNTGLNSASAGATIASTTPGSNSVLSFGTEGYNTGVTQTQTGGTGAITVATPFVGGASRGGGLNTTLATLAQSNGTANGAVLTLTNNAAISATTSAASDYTDTITVVGAGLF